jgi:hypothetical protein
MGIVKKKANRDCNKRGKGIRPICFPALESFLQFWLYRRAPGGLNYCDPARLPLERADGREISNGEGDEVEEETYRPVRSQKTGKRG